MRTTGLYQLTLSAVLLAASCAFAADAPAPIWPMYRGNPQRTGCSPFKGPAQMKVRWATDLKNEVYASPAVGADGTVYVGAKTTVFALSPQDGHIQWQYEAGKDNWAFSGRGGDLASSPALDGKGRLYVVSGGGTVGAVSVQPEADSRLVWKFERPRPVPWVGTVLSNYIMRASPLVAPDGAVYAGGYVKGNLVGLTPQGEPRWGDPEWSDIGTTASPALSPDGKTAYLGANDRKLRAFSTETGKELWSLPTDTYIPETVAVGADGTIYFGTWLLKVAEQPQWNPEVHFEGRLYAVSPAGTVLWSLPLKEPASSAPAIAPDGTLLIATFDGTLQAVRVAAGRPAVVWTADAKARYSSPLISADGKVYVGGMDGKLRAFQLADGKAAGEVSVGDRWVYGPPSPGGDGVLYVGSCDGKVYAIE